MSEDIAAIHARNARVDADKAWETSWARRLCIATLTYIFMNIWLPILGVPHAWMHASVPTIGYLLSTLSMAAIKRRWLQQRMRTA